MKNNKLMSKINKTNDEQVKLSNMFNDIIKQFDEKDVNKDLIPNVVGYSTDEDNCGLYDRKREIYNMVPAMTYYNNMIENIDSNTSVFNINNDFIEDANGESRLAVADGITLFFQNRISFLLAGIVNESEMIIYNWIHQCPDSVLSEIDVSSIEDTFYSIQPSQLGSTANENYNSIFLPIFYNNLDMNKYTMAGRILADTILSGTVTDLNNRSITIDTIIMIRNYIVNRFVQVACQLHYEYEIILNNVIIPLQDNKELEE